MKEQSLARGLAVFSIGLGLAELLAPRKVARLIGLPDDHDNLLRALGARELAAGIGIMQGNPGTFLWARVAGDAMDLGLLAAGLNSDRHDRRRLSIAIAAVAGVTALDVLAALQHSRDGIEPEWRVDHPDRAGIQRAAPHEHRASTDAIWNAEPKPQPATTDNPMATHPEPLLQQTAH